MADSVVFLTALDLEYNSVLRHLDEVKSHRHKAGTRFESGVISGTDCRVWLALTGVGNQGSAVIAERAIQEFSPIAVLFVGVAGSLWETTGIGDVVVAERVYSYQGGTSEDDGLKARPRSWEAPHELSQLAHRLDRSGRWRRRLAEGSTPGLRFGAVAAGEIVQNSSISREAIWIRDHYNDAIAIEMEAAGVASAGHLNNTMVGIVRGISDMADGSKEGRTDADRQPRAAQHAAAFAVGLAEELVNERKAVSMNDPEMRPAIGGNVSNRSSGQVGIQAGSVVNSTVWMHSGPAADRIGDIDAAVTDLRVEIAHAHAQGDVDSETFEAAEHELDTVEGALREPDEQGKKRAVLALKRLSGLAADLTEVAAKIALVIAAVMSLS